jgi:hypothetical protein
MPLHFRFKIGPFVYTERLGRRPRPTTPAAPWPPPGVKPLRPTAEWKIFAWMAGFLAAFFLVAIAINLITQGN